MLCYVLFISMIEPLKLETVYCMRTLTIYSKINYMDQHITK